MERDTNLDPPILNSQDQNTPKGIAFLPEYELALIKANADVGFNRRRKRFKKTNNGQMSQKRTQKN